MPAARRASSPNCPGTSEAAVGLSNLVLDRAGVGCHIDSDRLRESRMNGMPVTLA